MRGINDGEAAALAALAKDAPLEVRFIEMMPIGCGKGYTPVPTEEVYTALVKSFGKPNAFTTPRWAAARRFMYLFPPSKAMWALSAP